MSNQELSDNLDIASGDNLVLSSEEPSDAPSIDAIDAEDQHETLFKQVENDEELKSELKAQKKLIEEILTRMSRLDNSVSSSRQLIEERISYDAAKEKSFDHLYQELDALKKNADFERVKPLYIDLILLFDRIESIRDGCVREETFSANDITQVLSTLKDELLEILCRQGIEIVEPSPTIFTRASQKAISTESTEIESEDNEIAQTVRKGFRHSTGFIRAEEVIVKKYHG